MNTGYLMLEAKRALRNPRFLTFTVVFPVAIFLVEASVFGKQKLGDNVTYTSYLMCSLAAYGGFSAAMVTGARTALERAAGWQRQLRLTPLSSGGYLTAKGLIGLVVALPPIVVVAVLGMTVEGVHLTGAGWAQVILGVWVACIPFSVLGLLVGQLANSDTMQVLSAGITMLFGFLGGIFIPVEVFPHWLGSVAKVLPSYWLADVGHGALGGGDSDIGTASIVLAGWTVVLAIAVARRYRRDSARV